VIGQTISHYRLVAKLSGGMSISFKSGCRIRKALLMLEIQTRRLPPDIVVLEVSGRITIGRECKQLEWATDTLVHEKHEKKIILDLSGVTHIDSTGVGIIVTSAGQAKQAGGELRLAGANKHIEQVLKVTSVDKIVSWNQTVTEAAAGF
jgi:anti-sigma B factor antagonist